MPWSMFNDLWTTDPVYGGRRRPGGFRRTGVSGGYPLLNVYGSEEKLVITSEIPGMSAEDLDINVNKRTLTIKGSRVAPELSEDESYSYRERVSGGFERSITLPYEVEEDKVEARYENGVLMIHLPRTERDKPRKISVKAA